MTSNSNRLPYFQTFLVLFHNNRYRSDTCEFYLAPLLSPAAGVTFSKLRSWHSFLGSRWLIPLQHASEAPLLDVSTLTPDWFFPINIGVGTEAPARSLECGANHVKSPVHKTTSKYLRGHRWCFYTSSGFTEVLLLGWGWIWRINNWLRWRLTIRMGWGGSSVVCKHVGWNLVSPEPSASMVGRPACNSSPGRLDRESPEQVGERGGPCKDPCVWLKEPASVNPKEKR